MTYAKIQLLSIVNTLKCYSLLIITILFTYVYLIAQVGIVSTK